jgi:hypothetical protein
MAQVIETVFSIRTEESIANLNEVVGALGRTEAAGKKAAKGVSDEMAKIPASTKKAASGFNGLSNSINQVSRELPAFAFSAQTGFLAISNNIPILIDEITALRKANAALNADGKASVPVWKSVATALFSWQTALSVGISLSVLYAKEIGAFFGSLFKGREAIDSAKISLNALNKAYESQALKSSVQSLYEMRVNLAAANAGFINKDATLKEYNKTFGVTFGIAKSINEAEQTLIKGTPAYIQALVQRAAAQELINEASADLLARDKAEKDRIKVIKEIASVEKKIKDSKGTSTEDALLFQRQAAILGNLKSEKAALEISIEDYGKSLKEKLKLAEGYALESAKFLKTGVGDTGKGGTEILKTEFEKLKIQISELQTKIENGIYKDKNVAKDIALLAKLEQKVKDVEKAFSVLTGEDAELNFQAAIKDSEDFLTEIGKQSSDDLKDRRKEDKKAIEDKISANKEYYLRRKEQAGDNQKQLDIENENEILGDIEVYKAAVAAGEDYGDKLLAAEDKLRQLRLANDRKYGKEKKKIDEEIVMASIQIAQTASNEIFQRQRDNANANANAEISNLEALKEKKIISEEEFAKRKADIMNRNAEAQRQSDLAQISVNTALSIIKTFAQLGFPAGIVPAALAAAEGLVQYSFAASQPLPKFYAKGTDRVTGGIAGRDSVSAMLMPNEAVIPAKANMERQGLAKAWIGGDLDRHLAMNYINPAINEVNRKWETSLKLNQQSTFIRNDNFSDKKIVGELVKSNRLNRVLISSLSDNKSSKRNRRSWN